MNNSIAIPICIRRLLFLSVILLGGCSAGDPIKAWKRDVARYVTTEGEGDPSVLRELHAAQPRNSARTALTSFGNADGGGTSERAAGGVLLGMATATNRQWYVFVVGVWRPNHQGRSAIEDLRLIAFAVDGDRIHWREEPANAKRVTTYARGLRKTWSKPFPAPEDDFDFHFEGGVVTVTEKRSGVQFRLALASRA